MLRIDASVLDYAIIAIYFVVVLGIGFGAKRLLKTDLDFFLSGRSLPAWITGLAFIAANLGALEVLGMAANTRPLVDELEEEDDEVTGAEPEARAQP